MTEWQTQHHTITFKDATWNEAKCSVLSTFWDSRLTLLCVNENGRHGPQSSHLRCWGLKREWGGQPIHRPQKTVGFNVFHLDLCKRLSHVSSQFLFPFTPFCHPSYLSITRHSPSSNFSNPLMLVKRFPKPTVKFKCWAWHSGLLWFVQPYLPHSLCSGHHPGLFLIL